MSHRQRDLLAQPRWAQLRRIIDWHRDPLVAADGCTPAEIAAVEKRIGLPLPTTLREWFELLGHRIQPIQDPAGTPGTILAEADRVMVWGENQSVWSLWSPPGDDPVGVLDGAPAEAPLSAWLTGLLMSETLVGAWVGEGQGPLGTLAPGTRGGGLLDDVTPQEFESLRSHYPPLSWPLPTPWFTWHGDEDTVIRIGDGDFLEWFTATPEALGRLGDVLDLTHGDSRIVIRLGDLTPEEHDHLGEPGSRMLDITRFHGSAAAAGAVTALGDLVSTELRNDPPAAEIHLDTDQPEALCTLLVDTLAPTWGDRLTVARRPGRVAQFQVVHPG